MEKEKQHAILISKLLSPVSIAFITILIISLFPISPTDEFNPLLSIILGILLLCIFPVFIVLIYYKRGVVDIWVSEQKKRTPFYIVAIIGYILASLIFYQINYQNMFVLSLAYLFVTITIVIVNQISKVSSHTGGLVGPLTAIAFMYGFYVIPLLFLYPLVFWARKKLNAHTTLQLINGSIISLVITSIIYIILY